MTWLGSLVWSWLNAGVRRLRAPTVRFPVPVVSVGNIEAGGTGKTPWICAIAEWLLAEGRVAVILSRGYGGSISQRGAVDVLAPRESGVAGDLDPQRWGDEVAQMAGQLPGAWLGVGGDRLQAWGKIQSRLTPEQTRLAVILLDDGLQQFQVVRDFDLILVTGRTPGQVLFRELFFGVFGWGSGDPQRLWVWTKGISAPWLWKRRPLDQRLQAAFIARSSQSLKEKRVFLVCGVGHPHSVQQSLRELGANVVQSVLRPDHAVYSLDEIQGFRMEAERQNALVVITAKDAVKWQRLLGSTESFWATIDLVPEEAAFLAVRTRLLSVLEVQ